MNVPARGWPRAVSMHVGAWLVLLSAAAAQVDNDTCATAKLIGEGLVSGDGALAQSDLLVSYCGLESPFVHDLWYRFDAAEKGLLKATFGCAGANFDTGLFVYPNGCADLSVWGCNDDSCGLNSMIQRVVTPSQPLLIAVAGLGSSGQFTLKVTLDPISQFVIAAVRVSEGLAGFSGPLGSSDDFGEVATLGDFDGDGAVDVAVGAPGDDDGLIDAGAVWILTLSVDGTVLSQRKISNDGGGPLGSPWQHAAFGDSVAGLGDLDGDGTLDLAVGASGDTNGFWETGSIRVLFLQPDGTARASVKINQSMGGFGGVLDYLDGFGSGLANLGDVDGDGVVDVAVGAEGDDDGGENTGAVWILFLETDGTVKSWQKLSATSGGLPGTLPAGGHFGDAVGATGDIDGDGVPDLAVGAPLGGLDGQGAIWTVLLHADGTCKDAHEIDMPPGYLPGSSSPSTEFGAAICGMGDLNDDGVPDLAVGAPSVDHPSTGVVGAVFQVFLNVDGSLQQHSLLTDPAPPSYFWLLSVGRSLAFPGDVDGDGHVDLLIGAAGPGGSFWTVFLDPDNPWQTLSEGALEGGNKFAPELRGEGPLLPGTPWSLELSIAARHAPAAFVAGTSAASLPFKGGVLVPAPNLIVSGLMTDGDGRIELHGLWHAGVPSQLQLWIQAFVVDVGAPVGLSASNAVMATTP